MNVKSSKRIIFNACERKKCKNLISELQSEIQNDCDENMNLKCEINVPLSYSNVKIELANIVNPLQDKLFSQNVLKNILRSKYKY